MDMFKLGQMLGNAYGNLWVANANKRDDKQADEVKAGLQNQAAAAVDPYGKTYTIPGGANGDDITKAINEQLGPDEQITWNDMPNKPMDIGITKDGNYFIKGNLDLKNRPRVKNEDGSISTVRSMSFAPQEGGPEVLIPTVSKDGRIMSDNEAIDNFHRTGEHLGIFKNPKDADAYADRIHNTEAAKLANSGLGWRPQFTAEDFDKAMRERGIGKESRARALAQYKTELADQAQKEMLPDIVKAISSGNTQDALGALLQYRKYDPETANILAKDYQSALQYKRQQDLQDKHFNNQLALQNNALQNKIAYKGAVGSGGGGGGGGKTKTTKQEKMMTADGLTKQIDKIQAEIDALPSGSPEFMAKSATRDKLKGEYDALVNYGVEGQREYNDNYKAQREFVQNYDFNLNDWNQAAYLANDMIYRQAIPPRETIAKIKAAGAPDWVVSSLEGSYKDIL